MNGKNPTDKNQAATPGSDTGGTSRSSARSRSSTAASKTSTGDDLSARTPVTTGSKASAASGSSGAGTSGYGTGSSGGTASYGGTSGSSTATYGSATSGGTSGYGGYGGSSSYGGTSGSYGTAGTTGDRWGSSYAASERGKAGDESAEEGGGDWTSRISGLIDLKNRMDRNPYGTLAIAAGLGFLLGSGRLGTLLLGVVSNAAILPFVKRQLGGIIEEAMHGNRQVQGDVGTTARTVP